MSKSIQKSIRFSENLYKIADEMSQGMGLSIQNYIRYLVYEDLRRVHNPLIDQEKIEKSYLLEKIKDRESYKAEQHSIEVSKRSVQSLLNELGRKVIDE